MKNLKAKTKIIGLILSVSTLFSCTGVYYPPDPYLVDPERQKANTYYAPATPNAPLLSKKGSFSLAGHYGGNGKMHNSDAHVSYLPGKKIGLMANYRGAGFKEQTSLDESPDGSFSGVELGIGYVYPSKGLVHFEAYAGWGSLGINNEHHTGTSKINASTLFIQPALWLEDKKNVFQLAFVPRFIQQNFSVKYMSFDKDREPIVQKEFDILASNKTQFFFEPSVVARIGTDVLKFQFTYTHSSNLTIKNLNQQKQNFSFGIVLKPS